MGIAYNTSIVRDGLVLHLDAANPKSYPGSGTTWKDLSRNGNDGTLVNGVGYDSANNGAMVFDGSNDFSSHGSFLNMRLSDQTICTWVKLSRVAPYNSWFISKAIAAGADHRYAVGILGGTTKFRAFFCGISGTDIVPTASTNFEIGKYYLVSVVWDRSSNIRIFVNNQIQTLEGNSDISPWENIDMVANYPYRVGSYTEADSVGVFNSFSGNVSSVLHYNRALAESEIKQNFNALRGRYGI